MIDRQMADSRDDGTVKSTLAQPEVHQAWERAFRTDQNEASYEAAFDYLLRYLPPPDGVALLDAGCGGGAHSIRLARRGFQVVAIDFSEHVVSDARQRIADANLADSIAVQREDLTDLAFEDASFDCVLCWGVLMHVPDVRRALHNLCRVTKPGGTLVVEEVSMRSPEAWVSRGLARRFSKRNVESRRTAAGIENWATYDSGPLMWRHADPTWLRSELGRNGFVDVTRVSGQFTQLYNRFSEGRLTGAVHRLNGFWMTRIRVPYLAVTNLFVARKSPSG